MTKAGVFRLSCKRCSSFGIDADILETVRKLPKFGYKELRVEMHKMFDADNKEGIPETSLNILQEMLSRPNVPFSPFMGMIIAMTMLNSVTERDIARWICQAALLMARQSYTVTYRHNLDIYGNLFNGLHYYFITKSNLTLDDVLNLSEQTFYFNREEVYGGKVTMQDMFTHEDNSPLNRADAKDAVLRELRDAYCHGKIEGILKTVTEMMKTAPSALVNQDPLAALAVAVTGRSVLEEGE